MKNVKNPVEKRIKKQVSFFRDLFVKKWKVKKRSFFF